MKCPKCGSSRTKEDSCIVTCETCGSLVKECGKPKSKEKPEKKVWDSGQK